VEFGAPLLVSVLVLLLLRARQVLAHGGEKRLVVWERRRRLGHEGGRQEQPRHGRHDSSPPFGHGADVVVRHQTLRKRSAARSSVASRLAKQNRSTGPGSSSWRNGDTGMAATPCSSI